ncbi:MAG TPA: GAF domain-containing protein [Thermoanaerobaculia bacterium]|nr:GAF domain-containing protein [Thermoanaerobaculia bacterium]
MMKNTTVDAVLFAGSVDFSLETHDCAFARQSAIDELRELTHRSTGEALDLACALVTRTLGVQYSFFYEAGRPGIGFTHRGGRTWEAIVAEDALYQAVFSECARRNVPEYYCTQVGDSICVPVDGREGRLGVLTAHAAGKHAFSEADIDFLRTAAAAISQAIGRERTS